MTLMYNPTFTDDRELVLGQEIDNLLLRLRGLVLVGDLLAQRGASFAEIDAHTQEAHRVRAELAQLIAGRELDLDDHGYDTAA
jgi:hypothetical protein